MRITFNTEQLLAVSQVPKRTIQNWAAKHVLVPVEDLPGQGRQHRFEWRELEIARLLGELRKRRLPAAELAKLSSLFREIMRLPETGFLADNEDLRWWAERQIDGDGPALFRRSGAGAGGFDPASRQAYVDWSALPKMTPEQAAKFWCYVAHGVATKKKKPAAWLIWWGDDDVLSIHARLYFDLLDSLGTLNDERETPDGVWMQIAETTHPTKGAGIVLDLSVLAE